jgi:NitT/TauT family transport system substrate-binding protein
MDDRKPMIKQTAVPLCALLMMLGVVLIPRDAVKPRMKVALSVWPGSEPLVLARDSGMLKGQTRVLEMPWASAVTRAFDDEVVDVAVMTLDAVCLLRAEGHRLRVLRVLDQSTGGDALIARQPISTLNELRGKRVGVDFQGTGMFLLINALEQAGMTLRDIETVPLIQPEIESLFAKGDIDAAVASEPWLSQVSTEGTSRLFDSKALKTPIYRLLVASEQAGGQFQPEIRALIKSMEVMTARLRSGGRFEGAGAVLQRQKVPLPQFISGLERWHALSTEENMALMAGEKPRLEELAREVAAQLLRHGLIPGPLPAETWIDLQFLQ